MKRIIRTVDELGRITLPHEIREALNLFPKKQVTLELTDNGILVRKSEETPPKFQSIKYFWWVRCFEMFTWVVPYNL